MFAQSPLSRFTFFLKTLRASALLIILIMIEKLNIYKDAYLLNTVDSKWWKVLYIGNHFYKVVVKKKYRKREIVKNKIITNCLTNKQKRNGKYSGTN